MSTLFGDPTTCKWCKAPVRWYRTRYGGAWFMTENLHGIMWSTANKQRHKCKKMAEGWNFWLSNAPEDVRNRILMFREVQKNPESKDAMAYEKRYLREMKRLTLLYEKQGRTKRVLE